MGLILILNLINCWEVENAVKLGRCWSIALLQYISWECTFYFYLQSCPTYLLDMHMMHEHMIPILNKASYSWAYCQELESHNPSFQNTAHPDNGGYLSDSRGNQSLSLHTFQSSCDHISPSPWQWLHSPHTLLQSFLRHSNLVAVPLENIVMLSINDWTGFHTRLTVRFHKSILSIAFHWTVYMYI